VLLFIKLPPEPVRLFPTSSCQSLAVISLHGFLSVIKYICYWSSKTQGFKKCWGCTKKTEKKILAILPDTVGVLSLLFTINSLTDFRIKLSLSISYSMFFSYSHSVSWLSEYAITKPICRNNKFKTICCSALYNTQWSTVCVNNRNIFLRKWQIKNNLLFSLQLIPWKTHSYYSNISKQSSPLMCLHWQVPCLPSRFFSSFSSLEL